MKFIQKSISAIVLGLAAASGHAGTCTLDSFAITTMTSSKTGAAVTLPGAINATGCYGVVAGNDAQGGTNAPTDNLGYLEDGLLNGQTFKGNQLVSPTQFIDPSQLLALQDPTKQVDPGWIMLGTLDSGLGLMDAYDKPLDISKLVTFTMNSGGTWSLKTEANIAELLAAAGLFDRSYFDHLAFVVKAGSGANDKEGGWAIYDFDFNKLLLASGNAFDLTQPYSFTGTWNMDDFDGKAISHMSVWARDPISVNSVPVPGTMFLVGLGLLALGYGRKKAATQG